MIKYLKDSGCIQVERLLVLKGKEIGLTDEECHVILLVYILQDIRVKMITPTLLAKYLTITNRELDNILQSLLKKKMIYNQNGAIQLNQLLDKLLMSANQEDVTEISLLDIFEEQFGRPLSPLEMDIMKEWHEQGYEEEMIIKALKEAVKSQVLNFRYIEGILQNWSKNGIKQRYVEDIPKPRTVEASYYKWWEDE